MGARSVKSSSLGSTVRMGCAWAASQEWRVSGGGAVTARVEARAAEPRIRARRVMSIDGLRSDEQIRRSTREMVSRRHRALAIRDSSRSANDYPPSRRSQFVTASAQLLDISEKTDASRWRLGRSDQLAHRPQQRGDIGIVLPDPVFQLLELLHDLLVCAGGRTQVGESADHMDADLNGAWAPQNHGEHDGAVLGERDRSAPKVSEPQRF